MVITTFFPRMIEYHSSGMLSGVLALSEQQRLSIDHTTPATLNAFAQTSMADTFSIGFSGDVYSALMQCLATKLDELATTICARANVDPATIPDLKQILTASQSAISDAWFDTARRDSYPLRRVARLLK